MCGIAGIVHTDPEARVAEETLRAMCAAIRHRGPDDTGAYVNGPAGLGMTRLSIIDVAGGHQPIFNEDRTCAIVYNGEIYNHADVRRELERRGHRYATRSDTETILHAYEEYGTRCVTHLRGMFAIAIWDAKRSRLFLARDRLGKKPLYYFHDGNRLIFGSELKAVLAHPDVPRRVDEQALVDYAAWGYVPDPSSICRGAGVLSRRQYLDTHTYLPGDILAKVDRTSMMVSLESRAPLLDHVLAEFAVTIPPELQLKGMTTKYILKKVAERLLPREMVERPKMGFAIPVTYWLRGEWAEKSHDLVLGRRALERGIFRESFLRRIMDEHRRGRRDNSSLIWSLMVLELWWRNAVD